MTSPAVLNKLPANTELPPLKAGDRMDQKTFHARYEAMPNNVLAELVGGVVYMPSPLKLRHGYVHPYLSAWLALYKTATSGIEVADNATAILGEYSEPQPDNFLIILPEYGGQTQESEDGYLVGAPEWIAEVSDTSESYDLHTKRREYEATGVKEYVVVLTRQERIVWFVRREDIFVQIEAGSDGIYRSEYFPGLWLDPQALLRRDTNGIQEVLQQGLATENHAKFVEQLKQNFNSGRK